MTQLNLFRTTDKSNLCCADYDMSKLATTWINRLRSNKTNLGKAKVHETGQFKGKSAGKVKTKVLPHPISERKQQRKRKRKKEEKEVEGVRGEAGGEKTRSIWR